MSTRIVTIAACAGALLFGNLSGLTITPASAAMRAPLWVWLADKKVHNPDATNRHRSRVWNDPIIDKKGARVGKKSH